LIEKKFKIYLVESPEINEFARIELPSIINITEDLKNLA
jgi:hypothetical protein